MIIFRHFKIYPLGLGCWAVEKNGFSIILRSTIIERYTLESILAYIEIYHIMKGE